MTTTQIKKLESKVKLLQKRAARAQFELDMMKADWDIKHGNYKVLKSSADIKRFINKLR